MSPTQGVSGFVFQAQSDFFNLLIRALKVQGRIDVLSRPQVTALDNQQARVFVGQNFPIVLGSTVTATGLVSNNITYEPVGVQLVITPRITPDGRVIMRVTPEVSSTAPTNVSLGNGVTATAINQQIVDTTVVSMDGETVALGGLITKRDAKAENKVPWLGDLPYIGAAFRYRTQTKAKTELLVIMTPHIVRTRADADRILAEESKRMDWLLDGRGADAGAVRHGAGAAPQGVRAPGRAGRRGRQSAVAAAGAGRAGRAVHARAVDPAHTDGDARAGQPGNAAAAANRAAWRRSEDASPRPHRGPADGGPEPADLRHGAGTAPQHVRRPRELTRGRPSPSPSPLTPGRPRPRASRPTPRCRGCRPTAWRRRRLRRACRRTWPAGRRAGAPPAEEPKKDTAKWHLFRWN